MVKMTFEKFDDVVFGFMITKSFIIIDFWRYSLIIDFKGDR